MAICEDGHFSGSVSGGCVESAVIDEAAKVIKCGKARNLHFGVSDQAAWDVGLACGGEIDIFIQPIDWIRISPILDAIQQEGDTWYMISLDENADIFLIDPPESPYKEIPFVQESLGHPHLFLLSQSTLKLVIIGGVNIAQTLVDIANLVGYHTTILDPRKAFANPKRFPTANKIINAWPEKNLPINDRTAIAILTHDDKIDLPALKAALQSPAFYIGMLGSNKTQVRRKQELIKMGITPDQLKRIKGPIGLDIGATNPSEIALAIMAEIISSASQKRLES
jgi:xanthine dehydrogenase accessory factor